MGKSVFIFGILLLLSLGVVSAFNETLYDSASVDNRLALWNNNNHSISSACYGIPFEFYWDTDHYYSYYCMYGSPYDMFATQRNTANNEDLVGFAMDVNWSVSLGGDLKFYIGYGEFYDRSYGYRIWDGCYISVLYNTVTCSTDGVEDFTQSIGDLHTALLDSQYHNLRMYIINSTLQIDVDDVPFETVSGVSFHPVDNDRTVYGVMTGYVSVNYRNDIFIKNIYDITYVEPVPVCEEDWVSNDTACIGGSYTVQYFDLNNCGTTVELPVDNNQVKQCTVVPVVSDGRGVSSGSGVKGAHEIVVPEPVVVQQSVLAPVQSTTVSEPSILSRAWSNFKSWFLGLFGG